MDSTKKAPNTTVSNFKKTKILATIGPATNSYESILDLIKAGANGIRLNFSHGTNEEREQQIKWIRKASKAYGKPIAIVQDLHGPKMQLGEFDGVFPVQKDQHIQLKYKADFERSGMLPTKLDFSKKVKRGQRLLIADGKVKTTVTSVKDGIVHVRADNEGILIKNKGVNLPDTDFEGDVIPKKDKDDVAFGSGLDIDYVAQSFVQSAADVRAMKRILKNLNSHAKLIAKIETQAALDDIENIIEEADAIMVARGDLAVEASVEVVPIEQRRMIALCRMKSKPVIVATQMMASMVDNSEPTRAEVSDVATAVIIGADCVMLSEETAIGKYPVDTVKYMKKVAKYAESRSPVSAVYNLPLDKEQKTRQEQICRSVVDLADSMNATAIVAETKSGATALQLASKRPKEPLIAVTSDPRVGNQLALVFGIKSYVRPDSKLAATKLTNWLEKNKVLHKGDCIVTASGQYPGVVGTTDTIKVRVLQ